MKRSLVVFVMLAACGGTVPVTRYYQLASPATVTPDKSGDVVLAIEPLATDGAYDDARIVYRSDPYRLDYYEYHRWSAAPGQMVGAFLEQALAKTGAFRTVARETSKDTTAVLGGRVIAIEEIDDSKTSWQGRIALELTLTDPRSGEVVWSGTVEDREPLAVQSPEGLAKALSVATTRIAAKLGPEIVSRLARSASK